MEKKVDDGTGINGDRGRFSSLDDVDVWFPNNIGNMSK